MSIVRSRTFGRRERLDTPCITISQSLGAVPDTLGDSTIFIADQDYIVAEVRLGGDQIAVSDLSFNIRRCQGTEAPASGDLIVAVNLPVIGNGYNVVLTPSNFTNHVVLAENERLAWDTFGSSVVVGLGISIDLVPFPPKEYWLRDPT